MTSIIDTIRRSIPPINPEGHLFIGLFAIGAVILGFIDDALFVVGLGLTIWCILFFRDPKRATPAGDDLVVSPADGRVCFTGRRVPPSELGLGDAPMRCVSIFMSVFDVHVNRAPVTGEISHIAYRPGAFFNAELDKASEHNERKGYVFETDHGKVAAVQIAGLVARRIVSWANEGDRPMAGERIGMIRFGSRLDVYLPEQTRLNVAVDQRAIAGETVLGIMGEEPEDAVVRIS